MQILELHLKNFGKFTDCHMKFPEHIQVIYGENEYGKSTIYAFIKAMLFGMERGRGRAAGRDEFSRYEPWENPNYYAGMMRFRCGGRTFCLERTFDRYTKSTSLICEDDGEELSVEAGDLEMLLGGMTAASFENTVAIGQLTAKPGQNLAAELKNYAANYYETGSGEVDLQGALESLKRKKKQTEQEEKVYREAVRKKLDELELRKQYIEIDTRKLEEELAGVQSELKNTKPQELQKRAGYKWTLVGGILFLGGICGVLFLGQQSTLWKIGTVVLAAAGVFLMGYEMILRRQGGSIAESTDVGIPLQKLEWERARIQEELREKQTQQGNLQEQIQEVEEEDTVLQKLRKKRQALEIAETKLKEAAEELVQSFGDRLNREISQILCEITDGKYTRLLVDEALNMVVFRDGKRIPVERLSRGTVEQIYFSLRMAAVNILYEEEVPVILDDAFVFYDEKRLKCALKWLSEQSRQVIIFSCQTREKQLLASMENGRMKFNEDYIAEKGDNDY